jgi:hypothetical protein
VSSKSSRFGKADLGPEIFRDRFGRDHVVADRRDGAVVSLDAGGVGLGRADDDVRVDRARWRDDLAAVDFERGRLLIDGAAHALDGARQTTRQPCGMEGRGMRCEDAAVHAGGVDLGDRRGGREKLVLAVEAVAIHHLHSSGEAAELRGVGGKPEGAALGIAAIDVFAARDLADLVDGAKHLSEQRGARAFAALLVENVEARAGFGDAPSAIAAGGAKARRLSFDDSDLARWVCLEEVIGGPQSTKAGTDDDDVRFTIARQGGARRQRVARLERVVPIGNRCRHSSIPLRLWLGRHSLPQTPPHCR